MDEVTKIFKNNRGAKNLIIQPIPNHRIINGNKSRQVLYRVAKKI